LALTGDEIPAHGVGGRHLPCVRFRLGQGHRLEGGL
jgi:hypothetical protein